MAAVAVRDLQYALRLYQRLSSELGINGSDWFDLQMKMDFEKAEDRIEKGQVETALKTLTKAAFLLAWSQRKAAWIEAQKYFEQAVSLQRSARLPVAVARI
jgi:hypothetical protein